MVTVQPKKILHSLRLFVLRTIASLIFIPTILLLCTVSIIKPLALHNAGDRRNAVPCAALGCMKFTLVFLTLFFSGVTFIQIPRPFPFDLLLRAFNCASVLAISGDLRHRVGVQQLRQCARGIAHILHHAANVDQSARNAHRPLLFLPLLNEFPFARIMYMPVQHDRAIMLVLIKQNRVMTQNPQPILIVDLCVLLNALPIRREIRSDADARQQA